MGLPNRVVDRKFQDSASAVRLSLPRLKWPIFSKNEEINTMIYTIGAGVGSDPSEDANYDKIITTH